MQVVDWERKPVDADKEKHPNNMNVNEMILEKLHSSEERCCIYNHFCKAGPLTVWTVLALELPLGDRAVGHLVCNATPTQRFQ